MRGKITLMSELFLKKQFEKERLEFYLFFFYTLIDVLLCMY